MEPAQSNFTFDRSIIAKNAQKYALMKQFFDYIVNRQPTQNCEAFCKKYQLNAIAVCVFDFLDSVDLASVNLTEEVSKSLLEKFDSKIKKEYLSHPPKVDEEVSNHVKTMFADSVFKNWTAQRQFADARIKEIVRDKKLRDKKLGKKIGKLSPLSLTFKDQKNLVLSCSPDALDELYPHLSEDVKNWLLQNYSDVCEQLKDIHLKRKIAITHLDLNITNWGGKKDAFEDVYNKIIELCNASYDGFNEMRNLKACKDPKLSYALNSILSNMKSEASAKLNKEAHDKFIKAYNELHGGLDTLLLKIHAFNDALESELAKLSNSNEKAPLPEELAQLSIESEDRLQPQLKRPESFAKDLNPYCEQSMMLGNRTGLPRSDQSECQAGLNPYFEQSMIFSNRLPKVTDETEERRIRGEENWFSGRVGNKSEKEPNSSFK